MNARTKMTHRANAERDANTAKDEYNQSLPPNWQPLAVVPCFVWFPTERKVDDTTKTAQVSRLLAMAPLGTDITVADRIANVTNRRSTELFAGPLSIQTVIRKADHLLLELRRIA